MPYLSSKPLPDSVITCYKKDYVIITLHTGSGILTVKWLRPVDSREYRTGIKETGKILLENNLEKLLVNNQLMDVLTADDQGWLAKISIEVISKSELKYLAIVSSTNMMQQLTNEALDVRVKQETPPFETQYFYMERDAMEWLQGIYKE
ncbi:hypothetical protein [Pontibacter fetidus]|uniref:STAS/SEC14 domain-containing protein n=1 Tax=Pontibacter fetidus TaxID=2700082 RepID=A0A6B2H7P3_9BACT|nr:hypothetical protein [Pontibacter fetidus]NDK55322.1 hypothetical protein [Pontibacter fetidus]